MSLIKMEKRAVLFSDSNENSEKGKEKEDKPKMKESIDDGLCHNTKLYGTPQPTKQVHQNRRHM